MSDTEQTASARTYRVGEYLYIINPDDAKHIVRVDRYEMERVLEGSLSIDDIVEAIIPVSSIGMVAGSGAITLQTIKEPERRASGLFVAQEQQKNLRIGRVVSVGVATEEDDTTLYPLGALVAFTGMHAYPVKLPFDSNEYINVVARNILGLVLDPEIHAAVDQGVTA